MRTRHVGPRFGSATRSSTRSSQEECAKVLRCHFDGNGLFNGTSNRRTPPDGPLWPVGYRLLTDADISLNEKDLCPLTGLNVVGLR